MRASMKLCREVGHGGIVPHGWRMAWYEPHRRIGVYYPAPLHWVLRAAREFSYRLRIALRAPRIERAQVFEIQKSHRDHQQLADEYARGYLAGWRECFQTCIEAVEEELAHGDDVWDIGGMLTGPPKPPRKN
jgi:hypothetical protein